MKLNSTAFQPLHSTKHNKQKISFLNTSQLLISPKNITSSKNKRLSISPFRSPIQSQYSQKNIKQESIRIKDYVNNKIGLLNTLKKEEQREYKQQQSHCSTNSIIKPINKRKQQDETLNKTTTYNSSQQQNLQANESNLSLFSDVNSKNRQQTQNSNCLTFRNFEERKQTPFFSDKIQTIISIKDSPCDLDENEIFTSFGVQQEDVADEITSTFDYRKFNNNLQLVSHAYQMLQTPKSKALQFKESNNIDNNKSQVFKTMNSFINQSESASNKLVQTKEQLCKQLEVKKLAFQQQDSEMKLLNQHNVDLEKQIEFQIQKHQSLNKQVGDLSQQLDQIYHKQEAKIEFYKDQIVENEKLKKQNQSIIKKKSPRLTNNNQVHKQGQQLSQLERLMDEQDMQISELKQQIKKAQISEEQTLKQLKDIAKDGIQKILDISNKNSFIKKAKNFDQCKNNQK